LNSEADHEYVKKEAVKVSTPILGLLFAFFGVGVLSTVVFLKLFSDKKWTDIEMQGTVDYYEEEINNLKASIKKGEK
jgi:hypothetical protein